MGHASSTRSNTTIDESAGLELYINVPVQETLKLRIGLPVHLIDDRGAVLATERLSFVAASVDGATQSVLAKASLEKAVGLRTEQFVRARVVWSETPALTAPIVALNRLGGQFFAYVAESGEGGTTVARQRAVEPGPVVGNDYVVKSGLRAGDRLIVSGVHKIGDGAPVTIRAGAAAPLPTPSAANVQIATKRHGKIKQAEQMQVRKGIAACTAIANTRLNQNGKAILKAYANERPRCMWMA